MTPAPVTQEMKNINIIQVRQKLEGLQVEMDKLLEMLKYCERQERLRGQTTLTTNNNNTTTQQQTTTYDKRSWSEFVLKRWPTPEEFTLWLKKNPGCAARLEFYNHVTGEKATRWLQIEAMTLDLYPKFEVVGGG